MQIVCEICRDSKRQSSCNEVYPCFNVGPDLREHLVKKHAEYVARALLQPNVSDNLHMWLLANVDQAATFDTHNDDDNSMFNAHCSDDGRTTLVSDYNELQFKGRETASIDLKRKVECKACNAIISISSRQRHVYYSHLRKSNLFQCSACDYASSTSIWEIRRHCSSKHINEDAKAISNEEKYIQVIQMWNELCFPDWKQKKPLLYENNLSEEKKFLNENVYAKFEIKKDDMETNLEDNLQKLEKLKDVTSKSSLISLKEHIANDTSRKRSSARNNFSARVKNQCLDVDNLKKNEIKTQHKITSPKVKSPESAFHIDWTQLAAYAQSAVNAANSRIQLKSAPAKNNKDSSSTNNVELINSSIISSPTTCSLNDRICQVCCEDSRYPGRHIAQKHLSHHLYECPFGDGFGSYESCAVVKHIRKVHGANESTAPINNVEKLADEIMDLQKRCFPNRPLKLLRGYVTNKTDE